MQRVALEKLGFGIHYNVFNFVLILLTKPLFFELLSAFVQRLDLGTFEWAFLRIIYLF